MTHGTRRLAHIDYRWIALSNTTLGILMAALNASVVLIALPAIFRGIGVNPLGAGESDYLLWMLVGYTLVLAVGLVAAGRISDMYGRVRLYNAGFLVFTIGSILAFIVPGSGNGAVLWLIGSRMVQAIGGAFLMANSAAILTDAFPPDRRGFAMGVNQIAGLAGGFVGLLLGGFLAEVDWRAIFLVSVPFGVIGTIWAYLMLHETATIRHHQRLDIPGNLLFAVGLTAVLVAFTYALQPYGTSTMGWGNPWVIGGTLAGVAMLVAFVRVEARTADPMFHLELFRIRRFASGNIAGALASVARGGLQFILIVWLQGIWLPRHGYAFETTPLWAAVFMLPMTAGFLAAGPLSGALSDRRGTRRFATGGMLLSALGFGGLLLLPADFDYPAFGLLLFVHGVAQGVFAAPNTASVMNSVPAEHRGVASGMRAAFLNVGQSLSLTLIFTLVVMGLSANLPGALYSHLTAAGIPQDVATQLSHIPPIGALFAAFLGYNPMATLLPPATLAALPAATKAAVLDTSFFPTILAGPFLDGLQVAFTACVGVSLAAAVASWFHGPEPVVHETRPMPTGEAMLEVAGAEALLDPDEVDAPAGASSATG
jgi:MFS family permease